MKNICIILVAIFFLSSCCCKTSNCSSCNDFIPLQQKPLLTYDQAMAVPNPVVINFHMHGCGACKKAATALDKVRSEYKGPVNLAVVYYDDQQNICNQYGVRGYPSAFLVEPGTGNKIKLPRNTLNKKDKYIEFINNNWKDYANNMVETYFKQAKTLHSEGNYQQAIEKYETVLEFYPENSNVKQLIQQAKNDLSNQ